MALDRQCSIFSSGRTQGSPLQNVYRLTALPLAMGVICLFLLVSCEDTEKSGMTDKAAPGTVAAPDIALTRLDGEAFRLSDYRGKVVVLNFWATWCPPCRLEIPHFADLYRAYKDRGVVFLGISLDQDGAEPVRAFSEQHDIPYPVAMGNREVVLSFSRLNGIPTSSSGGGRVSMDNGNIQAIPTTFIIDREGKIYRKHVGYRERQHLEPELKLLLKETTETPVASL